MRHVALRKDSRVFVYGKPLRLNRSFGGLRKIVEEELKQEIKEGDFFVFVNNARTMIKVLYWDGDGFAIWAKQFQCAKVRMESLDELDRGGVKLLLDGIQLSKPRRGG